MAEEPVLRCLCDHINIIRKGKLRRVNIVGGAGGCTCAKGGFFGEKGKSAPFKVFSVAIKKR